MLQVDGHISLLPNGSEGNLATEQDGDKKRDGDREMERDRHRKMEIGDMSEKAVG